MERSYAARSRSSVQGVSPGRRQHDGRPLTALVAIVASAILVATAVTPASATYYGGGMNSQTFCVQNPSVNSTWQTPIDRGRNRWNYHPSFPGNISTYSGCTSTLDVASYGGTWLGLYTPLITGYQYEITLDSSNLNSHISANNYNFTNVVTSTTAHEFGHSLSLGHSSSSSLLMSHSRNRNIITSPKTSEVTESNSYY